MTEEHRLGLMRSVQLLLIGERVADAIDVVQRVRLDLMRNEDWTKPVTFNYLEETHGERT